MPANDVIALNLLYKEWCDERLIAGKAPHDLNPFEYFCADQFLKRFSLNDEELMRGMVDDSDDGGVDTFHFFINRVLTDDSTTIDRRSENDVDVIIMQIKENKGFSPTALEKMERFSDDLLDLQRKPEDYRHKYHDRLQDLMVTFKKKMTSMAYSNLRLEYYFVTRNDTPPNDNCQRAARSLSKTVLRHFPKAAVAPFNFAGAQEIYDQTRVRKPTKKFLSFEKSFDTDEGWVGLVQLKKFYEFLKDDLKPNELNETIFDDNVRGYYLNTLVNKAITSTLTKPGSEPEFWLLNNGITILTPNALSQSGRLEITDPQIVNGLQTSRRIFDYFKDGASLPENDKRRILVRVIPNKDLETRDEIIRATNNQNKMAAEALIATSRLHKQIDEFFVENGLFYDRRKGYYKDKNAEISKVVSILSVVQAIVAIVLRKPNDARGRPRDYVTKEDKRIRVFGHDDYGQTHDVLSKEAKPYDLAVYLKCVKILRQVDEFLESPTQNLDNVQQRNLRFYLARTVACSLTKSAYCPPHMLASAKVDKISKAELKRCLAIVRKIYEDSGNDDNAAKGKTMNVKLDALLMKKYASAEKKPKANKA